jgi:hypothetical protein
LVKEEGFLAVEEMEPSWVREEEEEAMEEGVRSKEVPEGSRKSLFTW